MFRPDHSIELLPVKTRVFPRRSMGQRNTRSNSDSNNKAEAALLNGTEGPLRFKQSPTRSVPHFEQSEEPNKKNRNNNSRTSRSSNNNNGGGNKSAENGGDVNRTMSLPLIAKGGSNGRLIGDGAWPASFSYSAMKDGESRRQKKPRELKQKKTQKPDSGKNSSSNNITTNNNDSNLSIRNTGELNEKPQLSLARSGAQLNSEIIASRRNSASVSMEERLPSAVSYSGSLNNFGSRPRSRSGSLRGLSLSRCSSRSSRSDGGGSDGMRMPLTEKQQVALRELPMAVTRCHTPPPPQLLRASSSFLVKKRSRRQVVRAAVLDDAEEDVDDGSEFGTRPTSVHTARHTTTPATAEATVVASASTGLPPAKTRPASANATRAHYIPPPLTETRRGRAPQPPRSVGSPRACELSTERKDKNDKDQQRRPSDKTENSKLTPRPNGVTTRRMPTPPPTAAAAAAATAASSSRQALSSKRLRSDATNDTSSGPHTTLPLATVRDLASAGINTNAIPRDNDLSNSDVVNMMTAWLFFDEPVVDNAGGSQPRMLASPNAGEASLRASAQKGVESRTSQLQRNSQNSPSPRISTNTATTSASSNTNTGSSRPEACVREKAPHRTDDMNPAVAALASATRVPTLPLQPRRRPLFHAGTWHNDSEEDVVDAAAAATAARPFSKALGPAASATTGAAAQSPVSDAAGGETSRVAEADDSDEYDYEDGEEDLLEGFYPEEYGQCAPRQSPNSIVFILTAEDSFSSSDNGLTDSKGAMRARGKDLWAPRKPRVLRRSTPLPLTPHNNKPVQCRYTSSPRLQDNALQSIEGPHEQPQLQLVRGRSSATVDSARQLELLRIYRPTSSKYAPDPSKMQRPVGNTFGLRRHRRANNADAAALVYGGAGAAAAAGKAGDAECDDDDDEEWEEDEEWVWEEVEVEECSDDDDDDGDGAEGEGDVSQSLEY